MPTYHRVQRLECITPMKTSSHTQHVLWPTVIFGKGYLIITMVPKQCQSRVCVQGKTFARFLPRFFFLLWNEVNPLSTTSQHKGNTQTQGIEKEFVSSHNNYSNDTLYVCSMQVSTMKSLPIANPSFSTHTNLRFTKTNNSKTRLLSTSVMKLRYLKILCFDYVNNTP